MEKVKENAKKINPKLEILELSCTSGEGLQQWYKWLKIRVLAPETVK
jgi:hydrogenase nickel incorporation protein HypB